MNVIKTYVKLKIENLKKEEILNAIKLKKIILSNFRISEKYIEFSIIEQDLDNVSKILNRYKVNILDVKKYGNGIIVNFLKNRMFLLIMIIALVPLLYSRLSFLKSIEVSGNEYISLDSVYITLRENNIRVGTKLKDIDTGYLENKFYIKYSNLKFVTFNLVGTNLYIEMIDYENNLNDN